MVIKRRMGAIGMADLLVLCLRPLRLELISRQELEKLRENGVRELSEVDKAYVEPDGQISVVKKK